MRYFGRCGRPSAGALPVCGRDTLSAGISLGLPTRRSSRWSRSAVSRVTSLGPSKRIGKVKATVNAKR
jgi:hypothetical protein